MVSTGSGVSIYGVALCVELRLQEIGRGEGGGGHRCPLWIVY